MTITLYPWTSETQIEQFKQYLTKHTPTTSSLLGHFIGTACFDFDRSQHIWVSHPDPLNTSDIVVWIIISEKRTRIYVNTEPQLDHAPMIITAATLADNKGYKGPYFVSEADEELFRQSLNKVKQAVLHHLQLDNRLTIEYADVSLLWHSVFDEFNKDYETICYRFVKQASTPLLPITQLPPTLKLTELVKPDDVELVRISNKILFDREYVEACFCMTSAIKKVDTNESVAWAMTHRDLYVGALHVLPDYRRRGLAEIILIDITRRYIDFYKQCLPDVPLSQMYINACVESYNTPSANLFKKAGWSQIGLGKCWICCNNIRKENLIE